MFHVPWAMATSPNLINRPVMEMYSSSYIRKWTLFCWIYDSNRGLNLHVDASWYSDFPQPSSTYLLSFAKFQVGLDADCCLDSSSFQPKCSSLWVSSYLPCERFLPRLTFFFFFALLGWLVGLLLFSFGLFPPACMLLLHCVTKKCRAMCTKR